MTTSANAAGDLTARFAELVGRSDPPLVIVTTAAEGCRAGCVVGFHGQSSINPVRYAVWISKANFTYRVALLAGHLALHRLDTANHDLAELFGGTTGDDIDKFARVAHSEGPFGMPLLDDCADRVVLERVAMLDDGGDHVCFIGAPVDVAIGPLRADPLRVSVVHDLQPGHEADDTIPPR